MRPFPYVKVLFCTDIFGILQKPYMTQDYMTTRFLASALSLLTILSVSCSDEAAENNGGNDSAEGYEKITIRPEREALVRNPLNGWVMYLGRSWNENFWTNPDSGYSPCSCKESATYSPS